MRFVVDCMLGSLAKWLKILGLDTYGSEELQEFFRPVNVQVTGPGGTKIIVLE